VTAARERERHEALPIALLELHATRAFTHGDARGRGGRLATHADLENREHPFAVGTAVAFGRGQLRTRRVLQRERECREILETKDRAPQSGGKVALADRLSIP
jgi:hypothetical protein